MKILIAPDTGNHHYHLPSNSLREFCALSATAIDIEQFPILARHWPGPMIFRGQLIANDDSPLCRRFCTEECAHTDSVNE